MCSVQQVNGIAATTSSGSDSAGHASAPSTPPKGSNAERDAHAQSRTREADAAKQTAARSKSNGPIASASASGEDANGNGNGNDDYKETSPHDKDDMDPKKKRGNPTFATASLPPDFCLLLKDPQAVHKAPSNYSSRARLAFDGKEGLCSAAYN